jgi:hypothetical protein
MVLDSMVKYIEVLRNVNLPDINISRVIASDTPSEDDYDVADAMNLLFTMNTYKMGYPVISFNEKNKAKLTSLTIGDSYNWYFFGKGYSGNVFSNPEFWFYYYELYKSDRQAPYKSNEVVLKNEIEKNQVIIILATEANYARLGWGFVKDVYALYTRSREEKNLMDEKRIKEIESSIKGTPSWLESVRGKAIKQNIPLDSMINLDARYTFELEKKSSMR